MRDVVSKPSSWQRRLLTLSSSDWEDPGGISLLVNNGVYAGVCLCCSPKACQLVFDDDDDDVKEKTRKKDPSLSVQHH
jgi:hypothetical protein